MIENHADLSLREFMLRNFRDIFSKYQSIPVDVLLEPLVKQLQVSEGSSYLLNVFDIEFLRDVAQHAQLKIKSGILLFDLLSKVYLNNFIWAPALLPSIRIVVERFIEQEPFQEYLLKMSKIALAMFFASCKEKKDRNNKKVKAGGKEA